MLAASGFLLLGAVLGGALRLPAFMLVVLATLAGYAVLRRHSPIATLSLDVLVALLALQAGYALTIVARLALAALRDRAATRARIEEDRPDHG
jgi:hypothetical protein